MQNGSDSTKTAKGIVPHEFNKLTMAFFSISLLQYGYSDVGMLFYESHPFCTMLDLQLSFYWPLCYNSRAHCPLLQCLCMTSAIVAGAHSYFVGSFKCEEKNNCHYLISNPCILKVHIILLNFNGGIKSNYIWISHTFIFFWLGLSKHITSVSMCSFLCLSSRDHFIFLLRVSSFYSYFCYIWLMER